MMCYFTQYLGLSDVERMTYNVTKSLTRNALLENGAKTSYIFDLIFFTLIS